MSLSKLHVVEMTDVLCLRLTCKKCGASLSVRFTENQNIARDCPNCSDLWITRDSIDLRALTDMARAFSALQARGHTSLCHIQLEFKQPE